MITLHFPENSRKNSISYRRSFLWGTRDGRFPNVGHKFIVMTTVDAGKVRYLQPSYDK